MFNSYFPSHNIGENFTYSPTNDLCMYCNPEDLYKNCRDRVDCGACNTQWKDLGGCKNFLEGKSTDTQPDSIDRKCKVCDPLVTKQFCRDDAPFDCDTCLGDFYDLGGCFALSIGNIAEPLLHEIKTHLLNVRCNPNSCPNVDFKATVAYCATKPADPPATKCNDCYSKFKDKGGCVDAYTAQNKAIDEVNSTFCASICLVFKDEPNDYCTAQISGLDCNACVQGMVNGGACTSVLDGKKDNLQNYWDQAKNTIHSHCEMCWRKLQQKCNEQVDNDICFAEFDKTTTCENALKNWRETTESFDKYVNDPAASAIEKKCSTIMPSQLLEHCKKKTEAPTTAPTLAPTDTIEVHHERRAQCSTCYKLCADNGGCLAYSSNNTFVMDAVISELDMTCRQCPEKDFAQYCRSEPSAISCGTCLAAFSNAGGCEKYINEDLDAVALLSIKIKGCEVCERSISSFCKNPEREIDCHRLYYSKGGCSGTTTKEHNEIILALPATCGMFAYSGYKAFCLNPIFKLPVTNCHKCKIDFNERGGCAAVSGGNDALSDILVKQLPPDCEVCGRSTYENYCDKFGPKLECSLCYETFAKAGGCRGVLQDIESVIENAAVITNALPNCNKCGTSNFKESCESYAASCNTCNALYQHFGGCQGKFIKDNDVMNFAISNLPLSCVKCNDHYDAYCEASQTKQICKQCYVSFYLAGGCTDPSAFAGNVGDECIMCYELEKKTGSTEFADFCATKPVDCNDCHMLFQKFDGCIAHKTSNSNGVGLAKTKLPTKCVCSDKSYEDYCDSLDAPAFVNSDFFEKSDYERLELLEEAESCYDCPQTVRSYCAQDNCEQCQLDLIRLDLCEIIIAPGFFDNVVDNVKVKGSLPSQCSGCKIMDFYENCYDWKAEQCKSCLDKIADQGGCTAWLNGDETTVSNLGADIAECTQSCVLVTDEYCQNWGCDQCNSQFSDNNGCQALLKLSPDWPAVVAAKPDICDKANCVLQERVDYCTAQKLEMCVFCLEKYQRNGGCAALITKDLNAAFRAEPDNCETCRVVFSAHCEISLQAKLSHHVPKIEKQGGPLEAESPTAQGSNSPTTAPGTSANSAFDRREVGGMWTQVKNTQSIFKNTKLAEAAVATTRADTNTNEEDEDFQMTQATEFSQKFIDMVLEKVKDRVINQAMQLTGANDVVQTISDETANIQKLLDKANSMLGLADENAPPVDDDSKNLIKFVTGCGISEFLDEMTDVSLTNIIDTIKERLETVLIKQADAGDNFVADTRRQFHPDPKSGRLLLTREKKSTRESGSMAQPTVDLVNELLAETIQTVKDLIDAKKLALMEVLNKYFPDDTQTDGIAATFENLRNKFFPNPAFFLDFGFEFALLKCTGEFGSYRPSLSPYAKVHAGFEFAWTESGVQVFFFVRPGFGMKAVVETDRPVTTSQLDALNSGVAARSIQPRRLDAERNDLEEALEEIDNAHQTVKDVSDWVGKVGDAVTGLRTLQCNIVPTKENTFRKIKKGFAAIVGIRQDYTKSTRGSWNLDFPVQQNKGECGDNEIIKLQKLVKSSFEPTNYVINWLHEDCAGTFVANGIGIEVKQGGKAADSADFLEMYQTSADRQAPGPSEATCADGEKYEKCQAEPWNEGCSDTFLKCAFLPVTSCNAELKTAAKTCEESWKLMEIQLKQLKDANPNFPPVRPLTTDDNGANVDELCKPWNVAKKGKANCPYTSGIRAKLTGTDDLCKQYFVFCKGLPIEEVFGPPYSHTMQVTKVVEDTEFAAGRTKLTWSIVKEASDIIGWNAKKWIVDTPFTADVITAGNPYPDFYNPYFPAPGMDFKDSLKKCGVYSPIKPFLDSLLELCDTMATAIVAFPDWHVCLIAQHWCSSYLSPWESPAYQYGLSNAAFEYFLTSPFPDELQVGIREQIMAASSGRTKSPTAQPTTSANAFDDPTALLGLKFCMYAIQSNFDSVCRSADADLHFEIHEQMGCGTYRRLCQPKSFTRHCSPELKNFVEIQKMNGDPDRNESFDCYKIYRDGKMDTLPSSLKGVCLSYVSYCRDGVSVDQADQGMKISWTGNIKLPLFGESDNASFCDINDSPFGLDQMFCTNKLDFICPVQTRDWVIDMAQEAQRKALELLVSYLGKGKWQLPFCYGPETDCKNKNAKKAVFGVVTAAIPDGVPKLEVDIDELLVGALFPIPFRLFSDTIADGVSNLISPIESMGLKNVKMTIQLERSAFELTACGIPKLPDGPTNKENIINCALESAQSKLDELELCASVTIKGLPGSPGKPGIPNVKPKLVEAKLSLPSLFAKVAGGATADGDAQIDPIVLIEKKAILQDSAGNGPSFYSAVQLGDDALVGDGAALTLGMKAGLRYCVERCTSALTGDAGPRWLQFEGTLEGQAESTPPSLTVEGSIELIGAWNNVFGIKLIHIYDVMAKGSVLVSVVPFVPNSVEVRGGFCLGVESDCDGKTDGTTLRGAVLAGIFPKEPDNNYFLGMITEVTLDVVMEILGKQEPFEYVGSVRQSLPNEVLSTGLYPRQECTNERLAKRQYLEDFGCYASLSYSPLMDVELEAGTNGVTLTIPQGYGFQGKIMLLSWSIEATINIGATSFLVNGKTI